MDLFDRIVNPKLLVRRIYVTANHVADEKTVSMKTEFEQMNLFVDYAAREAEQKAESGATGQRTQIAGGIIGHQEEIRQKCYFKRHESGRRGNSQTEKQSDWRP